MTATTRPASSSRTAAQEPAPIPAEAPAPTAPTADRPRNLARLTAQAEAAGWTATVQTQPGHCALVLTARQEAGETVLRCVWRLTARGYRWDGATLARGGQQSAEGIAWRAVGDLVDAEAPTARTEPTRPDLSMSVFGKRDASPVTAEAAAECRALASIADDHASRAGEAYEVTAHVARHTRRAYDVRPVDGLPDAESDTVRSALRRIDRRSIRADVCASRARYDAWGNPQDDPEYARQCAERARILADAAESDARRAGEVFAYAEYATEAELWTELEADRERERAEAARIDGGYALGEPRKVEGDARATLPVGSLVNVPGRGSWVRVVRVRLDGSGACVVDGTEVIGDVPGRGHARVHVDYSTPESGVWVVAQVAGEGAPVGAPATGDAPQNGPTGDTAPEADQCSVPVVVERPAVLPDVVSDPGRVDGWETDGGAVEVLPVICHGNAGGVFPVAFRGPYEGTVRVSRAWLTERARRELTVARERLTVAEEYAETCAAWRRDVYDLHQEVRRSAGVLGERVVVHYETSGGWSQRAREASWAADTRRMDARAAVRRCERELSGLEAEAAEPGHRSESARAFLARAVSGDVPAGRGAWVSADGVAVMFELPADVDVNPDVRHGEANEQRRAFVDLLADAVAARDEGRALIGRDLPSKKTHGRTGGIEKGQASASVKALVQPWKAPKVSAAGKAPTAATLEGWDSSWTDGGAVIAETEAAPGVWLPMAAVAFAETATANGWTVAMQRQGATVTVRAGGRATGKVPGEVRAVWSAGLYDVTASGAWVDGVRLGIVATLHAVNATISQECKAPGVLAEDAHADAVDLDGWEGEGGALARDGGALPPPAPRDEVSARAADVVSDPSAVDVWEAEGGAVPDVGTPAPVAAAVAVMPIDWAKPAGRGDCAAANTCGGFGVLLWDVPGCAPRCAECAARVMGHSPAALRALTLPGDVVEAEEEAEAADIVIRHTHEDGTTVEGSAKGDGVWEAMRPLGWTYRRTPGIFIRGSRYKGADRWKINRAAEAVRALGLSCAVVIEEGMSFAEREAARVDAAEERAERFTDRAGRAAASSQSARDASDRIGERFWMGQPILVGHHSEGRARRDQERMHNAMRKSIAEGERAGYWASRAAAADAYERYRKNPGRTLRRIEKLEAERRGVLRERDGVDDKGRTADVWRRKPSEARREELTRRLAEYDEELTYWAETIKEAERRGFKVWGRADFIKGDFVRWRGSWYEATRVNAKTVTVPHIHAAFDGGAVGAVDGCRVVTRAATAETRHKGSTYTLPYNEVSGRMSAAQMRAALAGEAIPADPRDITPEPAPSPGSPTDADGALNPPQ
ncbi:DUF3560 domain-containing protein [Streptomyces mirabilis]|uniref:DUF3560 domain-containing protein n=1 Tax=Streptomyces mirabilis TaxID=68239 RepID=UPI0037BBBCD0